MDEQLQDRRDKAEIEALKDNAAALARSESAPSEFTGPAQVVAAVPTGWGSWVREAWEQEAPACVRCGTPMHLNDGCEWSDLPELNLCHSCAITVLEELRPNNPAQTPEGQSPAGCL